MADKEMLKAEEAQEPSDAAKQAAPEELSEEDLQKVAGGMKHGIHHYRRWKRDQKHSQTYSHETGPEDPSENSIPSWQPGQTNA